VRQVVNADSAATLHPRLGSGRTPERANDPPWVNWLFDRSPALFGRKDHTSQASISLYLSERLGQALTPPSLTEGINVWFRHRAPYLGGLGVATLSMKKASSSRAPFKHPSGLHL
jgi:hypothetical protein